MKNLCLTTWLKASIFLCILNILCWGCTNIKPDQTEKITGQHGVEFPKMIIGDSWTKQTPLGTEHFEVIEVKSDGSFVFEVKRDGDENIWHEHFDNKYRLLKRINTKTEKVSRISDPPANILDFPLYVGKKWIQNHTIGSHTNEFKNYYSVHEIEKVDTPAGIFEAFKIHRKSVLSWAHEWFVNTEYWYSPKLKFIIKYSPSYEPGSELISYQLSPINVAVDQIEVISSKKKLDKDVKKKKDKKTIRILKGSLDKPIGTAGIRWAVVIGISKYQDTRIPSLRYASKDAKSFYNWIISPIGGQYAPSRVKLLINEQATGNRIKQSLFEWLGQVLEEDMVTIFFAGHGSPQSPDNPDNLFLLPYDVEYDSVATTGFPMWDIETALRRFIKAKKVIVIADACHAGGVGKSYDVARRAGRGINVVPISSNLQNLSKIGDGICIISASDDNQYSQESKKWGGGHGVFTYYLLQGLQGEADYNKDTIVSLGEIIPYLSEQVRRATRNAQTPTVAGRFDPALSIGK